MRNPVLTWLDTLKTVTSKTAVTTGGSAPGVQEVISLDQGVDWLRRMMRSTRMTFLVGNGGSLAIAAHMATDFNLAGLRTMALNCPIAHTSHANDFGVEAMFTKQLEWYADANDNLVLMSCSGNSPNMVDAALYGEAQGMRVISLTGFKPDNKLRQVTGAMNFHVPAHQYGHVQLAHESILHAACDLEAWHVNAEVE